MKIILFNLFLLIFISLETKAQSCKKPCPYYNDFMSLAQADTVKNTQAKLNYYRAAIVAAKDCNCSQLEQDANKQIDTLFVLIEAEKKKAEAQSRVIIEQRRNVELVLKKAKKAHEKNLKIVNAMDFYDGKLALAFKGEKYGFIDKEGNTKLDFKYDKGEPFDRATGFAEMEIKSRRYNTVTKYLLDTIGNSYELFNMSEEYMIGIRNEIARNKLKQNKKSKKKEINKNIESVEEGLYSDFGRYGGAMALNFYDIKKSSVLTILECLAGSANTRDRVEVLLFSGYEDEHIGTLPECITAFRNLKEIDIYGAKIKSIPENIDDLRHLKILKFPFEVWEIPSSIYNLERLEALDLSFTTLKVIPEAIGNLKNLKELSLPASLENIPSNIYNLTKLKFLYLLSVESKELSDSIGALKDLKELYLPKSLEKLPSSIYNLNNLEILSLSGTELTELSEGIGNLKNLKELSFPTSLESVPLSIYNLKNLESLFLSKMKIKVIPETIGNLKNLKKLSLPKSLENVPSSIYTLEKLEFLSLSDIKIESLPESIGNLINLERLDLSETRIESIPESIGNLINLEGLNLFNTNIKSIPESIGQLINLKTLFLPFSLETLPSSISDVINLEELDLSRTEVKSIPEDIGKLINLKELSLPPLLEKIPNSISDLVNLKRLGIQNSVKTKDFPDLSKLKKLTMFSFTLCRDENFSIFKEKLETLKEKLPNCHFNITDEKGEQILLGTVKK